MGNILHSRGGDNANDLSGDSSSTSTSPNINFNQFKIIITKSNTNSELTIGNRKLLTFNGIDNYFEYVEEESLYHKYHFFTTNNEEKISLLKNVYQILMENHFFEMNNKSGKTFTTSGSDAGTTITIFNNEKRHEIKFTERTTLKNKKQQEEFILIDKLLLELFENTLQNQYCNYKTITIKFSKKLVNYFLNELDSGFQLCLNNTKNKVVVCTRDAQNDELTMTGLTLPFSKGLKFIVCKYSLVSFGNDDKDNLISNDEIILNEKEKVELLLDMSDDKTLLVEKK
ncbi:hypothetical protein ABK040_015607 [Willaertia magna]